MVKIKNKHILKTKDLKILQKEISQKLDNSIVFLKEKIETGRIDNFEIIFFNGNPCFFRKNNQIFFTLKGLTIFNPKQNFVTVDMGAVKFVTNGADVMAPGIIDADKSIIEGDSVWICDENYKKPLAVGIALINGNELINQKKGKAVQMIHYIGDDLWDIIKNM